MQLFKLFKEVALINEQKFLAELGKLLTFMYEEDRQTAIELYAQMFASTADEHALMQFLGSPTRQAVQVARAYNAKERKLQVHAQSKNEDGLEYDPDEVPDFVLAINKIAVSAALIAAPAVTDEEREVPEGQFSLFDEASAEVEAAEDAPAEAPAAPAEAQPAEALVEEAPVELPAVAEPAEAPAEAPEEAVAETAPAEEMTECAGSAEEAGESAPAEEPAQADEPHAEENPSDADEFVIVIPELQEETPAPAIKPEEAAVPAAEDKPAAPASVETRRKPRVFLLILFVIFAVPITLIGVALLLIPTLFSLVLALGFIVVGVAALVSAFAGFAVFADVLVMLGIALVGLALGLLFLWLFVWFIGGAIVGLVKSVIALGSSWCYKEVPAV